MEDAQANEAALRNGKRLLSAYWTAKRGRPWAITEADRSATTLLLPDEYQQAAEKTRFGPGCFHPPEAGKKAQMQGGARCEARGVLSPYVAAPRERANPADGPFSAAC